MEELNQRFPSWGYRRIAETMRNEGWEVSDKKLYRLYRQEGLRFTKEARKRTSLRREAGTTLVASRPNQIWACDTTNDEDERGRRLVWLAAIDEFTRQCRVLNVHREMSGKVLVEEFSQAFECFGAPSNIRCDNAAVWRASRWRIWLTQSGCQARFIDRGKPWQNGHVESFFGRLKQEVLQSTEFTQLVDARTHAASWLDFYNTERPHSSLGMLPPDQYSHVVTGK